MSETVEPTDDLRMDPLLTFLDTIAGQLSMDVKVLREKLYQAEITLEDIASMSKPRTLCCYDISYEDAQLLIESAKSYTVPQVGVSQESSDSSEVLDVLTLSNELTSIHNWELLGVKLGIAVPKLDDIKNSSFNDVERCKIKLFDLWLRLNVSPSWRDIVKALEQMEENNLAEHIRQKYPIAFRGWPRPPMRQTSSVDSDSPNVVVIVPTSSVHVMPATKAVASNQSPTTNEDESDLINLLQSMTLEDRQEIEVSCRVFNASNNSLIQSTKAPLTRDIKIVRRPPKLQEFSSDTVPIGTSIRLEITADRDCYLYILNIGTSGRVSMLLPNEYDSENFFRANQTHYLPGEDFGFEIEGPAGKETIQIMAFSNKPSTLSSLTQTDIHVDKRALYRDITIRKKQPALQMNRVGYAQVQFHVK